MNKSQATALLIVGMAAGVGSRALLPKSADASATRSAFSHTIQKRGAEGATIFYVSTAALNEHGTIGPASAGVLVDPIQISAAQTYWTAVVEPSLTAKLGKPGRPDLFAPRDAGR